MPIPTLALFLFLVVTVATAQQPPKHPSEGAFTGCTPPGATVAAQANNDFGFALHRALREDGKNSVSSPWSVSEAFLFVRGCTTGKTRQEVEAAFRWSLPEGATDAAVIDRSAVELRERLKSATGPLKAANRLWLHAGVPAGTYREATIDALVKLHGGGVERIDFSTPEPARKSVNDWVSEQTARHIPELVPVGVLDASTRLVVTNAVHFKDVWAKSFDPAKTTAAPFHVNATETVSVPLMDGKRDVSFSTGAEGSFVEIPFQSDRFAYAFFAALPPEGRSLAEFEDGVDAAKFARWRAGLKDHKELRVRLPRLAFKSDYRLHERGLPELGMKEAFKFSADWSPLIADMLGIVYVGHQATFVLDESGAEAAAATVVVSARAGSAKKAPAFIADRPFLFAIVHRATGAVAFLGRFVKP